MEEVTEARTTLPYSAVCYVTVTFPDGYSARGSGVVIGPNDVLTAMHVVFQAGHGGWATQVGVTPGADTAPFDAPFGTFTDWGTLDGRTPNWDPNNDGWLTDDEAQWDLAVIGLRSAIGDAGGFLQPLQMAEDFSGTMAGFPAHPASGAGIGMMQQAVFADASAQYGVYDLESSLGAGASGGPLLYNAGGQVFVAGVLSSGTPDNTLSTYAGLFGPGNWNWLTQVTAANDGLMAGQPQTAINGTAGADTLLGDALSNVVSAGTGDDTITGGGGNDLLDGGEGSDTAVFGGARADYTLTASASAFISFDSAAGRDGTDRLEQVERLQFADGNIALDLGGNAGLVARILGAVFGPASLANEYYAGVGLWHLDHGMAYQGLVQLALDVRLGAGAGDAAVVDLLYTNVVGTAPSAEAAAYYLGLIEGGQASQAGLGVFAADAGLNALHIGLAGLASTGLAYEPAG
jgi:V8-like Glu-specific endopeptidase